MSTIPFLDKNAYLSIYLSQDNITANLSYSHYTINRHYFLSDKTYYDPERDNVEDQRFWDEYFLSLSQKFKWEFVRSTDTEISMASTIDFEDEGFGVSGISFVFHGNVSNRVKVQSVIHSYLPTASIKIINEKNLENFMPVFGKKTGYDDILILNIDLDTFDLFSFMNLSSFGSEKKKDKYRSGSAKIYWDNKEHLINSIKDRRFVAFSSVDVGNSAVRNIWANYVQRPVNSSNSYDLHDLLRSFLTVQLATLFNNNNKLLRGFGNKNERALLLVTGKMAQFLETKEIIVGLLDGLQLAGNFDLYLDKDARFFTYAEMYSKGINSPDYIVPDRTVIDKLDKIYIVEAPSKGKKRSVLTGDIVMGGKKVEDLFVVAPDLLKVKIPYSEKEKSVLSGKFVKNAYVEGLEDELILTSSEEELVYDNVYFDCRLRPIVYGPDPRSNRSKLKVWISE